jgi:hypothetical protein
MRGHSVVGKQGVQEGTEHTPLRGPHVEGQRGACVVAYPHHLGVAHLVGLRHWAALGRDYLL